MVLLCRLPSDGLLLKYGLCQRGAWLLSRGQPAPDPGAEAADRLDECCEHREDPGCALVVVVVVVDDVLLGGAEVGTDGTFAGRFSGRRLSCWSCIRCWTCRCQSVMWCGVCESGNGHDFAMLSGSAAPRRRSSAFVVLVGNGRVAARPVATLID